MKKTLAALTLALALLTVNAAAFSDVDEGLYYAAPIAWAVDEGVTTGTTETTFSPDVLCTRGQLITFLWRCAGSPEPQSMESPYGDVTPDMNRDIYKAILWAGETGVIQFDDLDADTFSPNAPCHRSSAVRFLWRYAGSPDAGVPDAFTDVSPEADYAQAVAWAVEAGITSGTTDSTFSPGEPCTRGQIVTFLYRCMNEDAGSSAAPADPAPAQTAPADPPRPLRTLTGRGDAYSLGLDGSEFTSEEAYEAEAVVDIYSSTEAVITVQVPFPLFQACSYAVRFDDPEGLGGGCAFTCLRWDEAFSDMIPWEGEPVQFLFTDMSGKQAGCAAAIEEEHRTDGVLSWRVVFPSGSFSFDALDGYALSCEVTASR